MAPLFVSPPIRFFSFLYDVIFFADAMAEEVIRNVDPEVGAIVLEPLLARANVDTAIYSRERQTLTLTGSGSLRETLQSVLQYRVDQLQSIKESFAAAVVAARGVRSSS